jgi:hypothetical protein
MPTPPLPLPGPSAGPRLADDQLAQISAWYRGAVAKGITDNQHKRSQIAKDGLRLSRRFRDHQDMILRFATDLAVGFTSNQADYAEFGVMRTRRWMSWHAGGAGQARPA